MLPDVKEKAAAFEREALQHLNTLYSFALRLTGVEVQAEDLVQETMLRAYRSWHRFESGTNVRAWLLTILRNTFVSEHRRKRLLGPLLDVTEYESSLSGVERADIDPEGSLFDQLVDEEVIREIQALPEEFRTALVLVDIEGLRYEEVAEVTGVPVGTVKSRLYRARRALQKRLRDYAVEMGYIEPALEAI